MLASSYPVNFPVPFANSAGVGYIRAIPTASQIGITQGAASLTDGFPPLNFLPTTSGGVPPFGQDMNGILNEITANIQWEQAGGQPIYSAAFSTAIGGYPNGAVLQSVDGTGFWRSTVDNNTSNPETGGANWVPHFFYGSASIPLTNADVTLTLAQSAKPLLILTGAITANLNLILPITVNKWIIQNNTTGAFTVTAKTLAGTGVAVTQATATYVFGDGTNIYSSGGITQTAGDLRYAKLAGLATQLFSVANGISGNQAVNFGQFPSTLAATGAQSLPGGLLIKWGLTASIASTYTLAITFATSFPNAAFGVLTGSSGNDAYYTSLTTTGFTIGNNGTVGNTIFWLAIGY